MRRRHRIQIHHITGNQNTTRLHDTHLQKHARYTATQAPGAGGEKLPPPWLCMGVAACGGWIEGSPAFRRTLMLAPLTPADGPTTRTARTGTTDTPRQPTPRQQTPSTRSADTAPSPTAEHPPQRKKTGNTYRLRQNRGHTKPAEIRTTKRGRQRTNRIRTRRKGSGRRQPPTIHTTTNPQPTIQVDIELRHRMTQHRHRRIPKMILTQNRIPGQHHIKGRIRRPQLHLRGIARGQISQITTRKQPATTQRQHQDTHDTTPHRNLLRQTTRTRRPPRTKRRTPARTAGDNIAQASMTSPNSTPNRSANAAPPEMHSSNPLQEQSFGAPPQCPENPCVAGSIPALPIRLLSPAGAESFELTRAIKRRRSVNRPPPQSCHHPSTDLTINHPSATKRNRFRHTMIPTPPALLSRWMPCRCCPG